jgi:nucleoside-diphosphate-sugar epimerase
MDLKPGCCAYLTGASGFVGVALSSFLTEAGWMVRKDPLRLMMHPEKWRTIMTGAQCVVHLAARVHQLEVDPKTQAAYHEINVEGSRFVAEQAVLAGVRRLVFISSVKVNGEGGELPYQATDEPNPQDAYGISKLAAERIIREVCDLGKIEWVIIRPPLVYGPGVKANFRRLMRLVDLGLPLPLGSIQNQRSLVGLSNLVSFIETCMTHPRACGKSWLIADDESVSTPELLRRIAHQMGRRMRLISISPKWLRHLAVPLHLRAEIARLCDSLLVDASPARVELGWRSTHSLDYELARTVAAYRAERIR